jgi:RNA polymerase sigma-70 factor (ECF subfamily)
MHVADGSEEFVQRAEPFRRELLAHCYRMLGSADEAEDLVQETFLRAWRSYGAFEGRSSLRAWLYRIATNACLTALEQRGRRALPSGLGGPADDPDASPEPADPDVAWLQPIPDALVSPDTADPATIIAAREGVRLALVASLGRYPHRHPSRHRPHHRLRWRPEPGSGVRPPARPRGTRAMTTAQRNTRSARPESN